MHKPGWKTSEFWVTAAAIVGVVASSIAGAFNGHVAAYGIAISVAAYAISRGLAKLFPPALTAPAVTPTPVAAAPVPAATPAAGGTTPTP